MAVSEKTLEGLCTFYFETGTEGGDWAFQDSQFICKEGWSYEGLHILRDGDQLTIYDPNNIDITIWSGIINLKQYDSFKEVAKGYWIHADQIGIDRETWANFFFNEYPATLCKK